MKHSKLWDRLMRLRRKALKARKKLIRTIVGQPHWPRPAF